MEQGLPIMILLWGAIIATALFPLGWVIWKSLRS